MLGVRPVSRPNSWKTVGDQFAARNLSDRKLKKKDFIYFFMGGYFLRKELMNAINGYMSEGGHCENFRELGQQYLIQLKGICANVFAQIQFIEQAIAEHNMSKITAKILWITIRPATGTWLPEDFVRKLKVVVHKPYVEKFAYSVEQTGETAFKMGTGMHFHLLLKFTNRSDAVIRMLKDIFPGAYCYIKNCPERIVKDKLLYMSGYKRKEKKAKLEMDVLFRETFEIESPVYSGWEIPPWPEGAKAWEDPEGSTTDTPSDDESELF